MFSRAAGRSASRHDASRRVVDRGCIERATEGAGRYEVIDGRGGAVPTPSFPCRRTIRMKNCRLPCQLGTDVSGVEAGTGVDIRVRDRTGFHAERRDALGCNKRTRGAAEVKA